MCIHNHKHTVVLCISARGWSVGKPTRRVAPSVLATWNQCWLFWFSSFIIVKSNNGEDNRVLATWNRFLINCCFSCPTSSIPTLVSDCVGNDYGFWSFQIKPNLPNLSTWPTRPILPPDLNNHLTYPSTHHHNIQIQTYNFQDLSLKTHLTYLHYMVFFDAWNPRTNDIK